MKTPHVRSEPTFSGRRESQLQSDRMEYQHLQCEKNFGGLQIRFLSSGGLQIHPHEGHHIKTIVCV